LFVLIYVQLLCSSSGVSEAVRWGRSDVRSEVCHGAPETTKIHPKNSQNKKNTQQHFKQQKYNNAATIFFFRPSRRAPATHRLVRRSLCFVPAGKGGATMFNTQQKTFICACAVRHLLVKTSRVSMFAMHVLLLLLLSFQL
jgi:hypothetical protein